MLRARIPLTDRILDTQKQWDAFDAIFGSGEEAVAAEEDSIASEAVSGPPAFTPQRSRAGTCGVVHKHHSRLREPLTRQ